MATVDRLTNNKLKISKLTARFQPIVESVVADLEKLGWKPKVMEGLRTLETQKAYVKRGVSKTLRSYHLTGNAVDIVDERYLWNVSRLHTFWYDYARIIFKHAKKQPKLGWGGIWSGRGNIAREQSRWAEYEKQHKNHISKNARDTLSWFVDVAHMELR